MLVYKHNDCLLKDNGFNHPERKERIDSILESMPVKKGVLLLNIVTILFSPDMSSNHSEFFD